eukprot:189722_1
MYSNVAASEHEHNWICPQCQRENDKARFLCIHDQCDHINLPPEDGTKTIEYRAIPIQVQRELLICGFTKEIILIANVPNDIISLIVQYYVENVVDLTMMAIGALFEGQLDVNRHQVNAVYKENNIDTFKVSTITEMEFASILR